MLSKPRLKLVNYDPSRHCPKDSVEKLNDIFFILSVLAKGEEKNISVTTGTLVKTLFTSQFDLSKDIKFWHTGFYPFTLGPFNKKFYSYINELEEIGLIQKDEHNLSLTTKGANLIQPLFEEIKKESQDYNSIENRIEENLGECKDFFQKSKELHKEKLIDETSGDDKIIEMQEAIDNSPKYLDKYIESIEKPAREFVLPNNIINRLLKIEAEVENSDYKEKIVLKNSNQLLEILK